LIRIGVAGLGWWGKIHLEVLATLAHFKVVALCDKDGRALQNCGERYGISNLSDNMDDFLSEDFDAVDLILPHFLNCEIVVKAASSGKHVLVEEPMASRLEEADRMIRACRKSGVKLMVGANRRFSYAVQRAKDMLEAGIIGKLFLIRGSYLRHMDWAGSDWHLDRRLMGGGVLMDGGFHPMDLGCYLGGKVIEVYAMVGSVGLEGRVKGGDTAVVNLKYRNGALGHIVVTNGPSVPREERIFLHGTKGVIGVDYNLNRAVLMDEYGKKIQDYRVDGNPSYQSLKEEFKHFYDCICKGKEPISDGESVMESLMVIKAAERSSALGKPIRLHYRSS